MLVNAVWKVEKATEKREIAIRNVLAPPEAFYRCRKRFSASGSGFSASGSVFSASGSDLPLSEARFSLPEAFNHCRRQNKRSRQR